MSADISKSEDTLGDVLKDIWNARGFVLVGIVAGGLLALVLMLAAVPHSKAQVILAPANPMNISAMNVKQQAYGSAPQSTGQDVVASFTRFEASYKGATVAGLLLRDPEITAGLARDKGFKFLGAEQGWSPEKLADYIERRVHSDPVGETSLRALSYLHPDKDFAVTFLSRLHNVTDGLIRHSMRKEVNERIAYLNEALGETFNPDHRRAMTDLLMEQERLKMLVSIDQPYAASVIVPPSASVKTVWPDPMLVYPVFMAVGALIGFALFNLTGGRDEDILAGFDAVKQREWFFPESGNNNEKPPEKRPLTGKKKMLKRKPETPESGTPSEAAE